VPTLNERAEAILKALIQLYVHDGHPIGSRTLAREGGLDLSPATIRNVMYDLEDLGLIRAPHTSAGRVPTPKGYRFFVDTLLRVKAPDETVVREIEGRLAGESDPALLMTGASRMLSRLTRYAGVVLVPGAGAAKFRQIEFLALGPGRVLAILVTDDGRVQNRVVPTDHQYSASELVEAANCFNESYTGRALSEVRRALYESLRRHTDEMHRGMQTAVAMAGRMFTDEASEDENVVLSGEENLFAVPDLSQVDTLQKLFDAFKTKQDLLDLLDRSMKVSGVSIFIGDESGYQALHDCSVVTATYTSEGRIVGTIGVIGPTRMAYEEVIPVVDITARLLSASLSS
jgi:heat-inducible transcriptional repressor